jgi:hypothetical protein
MSASENLPERINAAKRMLDEEVFVEDSKGSMYLGFLFRAEDDEIGIIWKTVGSLVGRVFKWGEIKRITPSLITDPNERR